jgi:hypothetical protein
MNKTEPNPLLLEHEFRIGDEVTLTREAAKQTAYPFKAGTSIVKAAYHDRVRLEWDLGGNIEWNPLDLVKVAHDLRKMRAA